MGRVVSIGETAMRTIQYATIALIVVAIVLGSFFVMSQATPTTGGVRDFCEPAHSKRSYDQCSISGI
ncbi:MAG: hypothetical protein M1368_00865 [Thaumarchaeota archaeon]|nr:hypothetical protein [Nitrososphaerota archaeon]